LGKEDMSMVEERHNGFLNLEHARYDDQRVVMERIIATGKCPFCPDMIDTELVQMRPVLKRGQYWHVRENNWPYKNTRVHLLVVLNEHGERLADLTLSAWGELLEILQWAEKEYNITGGGFGMRFGDIGVNHASVAHLHVHIMTAAITDKEDPDYKEVRLRVG
jgi:diadenosine tetraphosphate (Ap4A) HIT family hydrolase